MNRKLPLRLYLTTKFVADTEKDKSSDGEKKDENVWTFPSTIARENETMLDAALRVFAETLGKRCTYSHIYIKSYIHNLCL